MVRRAFDSYAFRRDVIGSELIAHKPPLIFSAERCSLEDYPAAGDFVQDAPPHSDHLRCDLIEWCQAPECDRPIGSLTDIRHRVSHFKRQITPGYAQDALCIEAHFFGWYDLTVAD